MNLSARIAGQVAAVLMLAAGSPVTAQNAEPAPEYAQVMPLASSALLLDVTGDGEGGFIAVGERGHIIRSADGVNWIQAERVPTRSTLTAITRIDRSYWAAGHDSVILFSPDGGVTWTQQYFDPERQQAIMDILFLDAGHGFAIGAYGLMLETLDGGETWDDVAVSDEEWHLNAMLEVDAERLMITGEAGFSYRSFDQGESWEVIEMPYPGSMFGIVPTEDECILVFGLRGTVQVSCDFGDTWDEFDSGTESSLSGGLPIDSGVLIAGNSGVILELDYETGATVHTHSSGTDFAAITRLGSDRYLLVGEDGVQYFPETPSGEPAQ